MEENSKNGSDKKVDSTNYATLWCDHSKLLWSRLQTLLVFNGACLAAWWKIRESHSCHSQLLLVLGFAVSSILLLIMSRDAQWVSNLGEEARERGELKDFGKPKVGGTDLAIILGLVPLGIYCGLFLWDLNLLNHT